MKTNLSFGFQHECALHGMFFFARFSSRSIFGFIFLLFLFFSLSLCVCFACFALKVNISV